MTTRRRTLLLTCALGFSAVLVPAGMAAAAPGQDGGATFGGEGATTTTVVATTTTAVGATTTAAGTDSSPTKVDVQEASEQPLFTESRKVAAIVGGLVVVAIALLLLTIRYWRVTKPLPAEEPDIPALPGDIVLPDPTPVDPADEPIFVTTDPADEPVFVPSDTAQTPAVTAAALAASSGNDHDAADDDWEPRTGEQERVEIPTGSALARPGVAARRKALGLVDQD